MASSSPNRLRLSCSSRIVVRPNIALHITKLSTCRDEMQKQMQWTKVKFENVTHVDSIMLYYTYTNTILILYHDIFMKSVANSGSNLLEVPTIFCKACVRGYIPPRYGFIWHSTSSLGTWNGHKMNPTEAVVITLKGTKIPLTHAEIIACIYPLVI